MRYILFYSILVLFCLISPFTAISEEAFDPIKQLSSLPEDKIDVGRACLLFAKEAYPELNVDEYSKKIDQIALEIKKFTDKTGDGADPDHRVRAFNTYFYQTQGYHYDSEDPYSQKKKNRYINGLLDTKSGSCLTLPLLYFAVAQRLGYPVHLVAGPQHLFLRYDDKRLKYQNIEATSGGSWSPDIRIINDLEIPKKGIESGCYLRTLNNKEFLGELYAENARYWAIKAETRNPTKAVQYFEEAIRLNPYNAEAYLNYAGYLRLCASYDIREEDVPEQYLQMISRDPLMKNYTDRKAMVLQDTGTIYDEKLIELDRILDEVMNNISQDPMAEIYQSLQDPQKYNAQSLDPNKMIQELASPEHYMRHNLSREDLMKRLEIKRQLKLFMDEVSKAELLKKKAHDLGAAPPLKEDYWIRQEHLDNEFMFSHGGEYEQ